MTTIPKMTFLPTPVPAAPQTMSSGTPSNIDAVGAALQQAFGASALQRIEKAHKGTPFVVVDGAKIVDVLRFLRDDPRFQCTNLNVVSSVDYPPLKAVAASEGVEARPAQDGRIEVIYVVSSYSFKHEFMVKAFLDREHPSVPSVCELFRSANWYERECYDLVGVEFTNHPNLQRILLPQDWLGHPLRRDYIFPEEYNGMKVPL